MSILFVVRHGQASFLADNYDQLSEIGREQGRRLGRYWALRGVRLDQVIIGPCVRHLDTARHAAEAYLEHGGRDWPEGETYAEFDEYKAEAVLRTALPGLLETRPELRAMYEAFQAAEQRADKLRTFQRFYEIVIAGWAERKFDVPDVEPWGAFCQRVHAGFERIAQQAGNRRQVAVFTSGGPVGVSVSRATGANDRRTLEAAWMVRNGSYSTFLFSGDRFTMSQFNAYPHLEEDEQLLTYR